MRSQLSLAAAAFIFAAAIVVHPAAQRGAPPADAPAGQGQPARGGGGRATFPAQQRPPGDPALIARGNGLYGINCRACHGNDLRGGDQGGPNLLRSDIVLNDRAGELLAPVIVNGREGPGGSMPAFPLAAEDVRALAAYIHSVTASMRGQGSPPLGAAPKLNVVVGNAATGEAYVARHCGTCHSAAGDLRGIGARFTDPTALQNYWLSAGGGLGRGGRGGAAVPASRLMKATITAANGTRVEGLLVRLDDFYVVVRLADGTERSFRRNGELPAIDLRDPLEGHRKLLPIYTDKDIHDVTAYLVTLK